MYFRSLLAGALAATTASAAEPLVFHVSSLEDSRAVRFSLLTSSLSDDRNYDFDVSIGLAKVTENGSVLFRDKGTHPARVKCATPAQVFVGGNDYAVGTPDTSRDTDWKYQLWRAVCGMPTS